MKNILILAAVLVTLVLIYFLTGQVDSFVKSRRRKGDPYPFIPETLLCLFRRLCDMITGKGRCS